MAGPLLVRKRRRRERVLPLQAGLLVATLVGVCLYQLALGPAGGAAAPHATADEATSRRLLQLDGQLEDDPELQPCPPIGVVDSDFPEDTFTPEEKARGWILVHVLVMLYMFLGLAIVCDDYFEAALSQICDSLALKDDVAGATFMAAGGSAPELATSVMGVFVAKSDVGFGTIVGSAIFNVLFVIAMCSFVAPGLQLTWWPLVRDSVYYCTSIAILVAFISDQAVTWWESLALLFLYAGYISIMYYNESLQAWTERKVYEAQTQPRPPHRERLVVLVESKPFVYFIMAVIVVNVFMVIFSNLFASAVLEGVNLACAAIFIAEIALKLYSYGFFQCWQDALNVFDGVLVLLIIVELAWTGSGTASGLRVLRFIRVVRVLRAARLYRLLAKSYRDNATQVREGDFNLAPTGTIPLSQQVHLSAERTFFEQVLGGAERPGGESVQPSGHRPSIVRVAPEGNHHAAAHHAIGHRPKAAAALGALTKRAEPEWRGAEARYSAGERAARANTEAEAQPAHACKTAPAAVPAVPTVPADDASFTTEAMGDADGGGDALVRAAAAHERPRPRAFAPGDEDTEAGGGRGVAAGIAAAAEHGPDPADADADGGADDGGGEGEDDDDNEPSNPFELPSSATGRFVWALSFPLLLSMWLTIPDCRRPLFKRFFFATFLMSIVWIAFLSYFMVWMATELGITANIPAPVMGLTLLAGGTSIPDCLSSMAVARKGHGDMAVSSSLGSNIFDILIGLPVPWFLFTTIMGTDVTIQSEGLALMISLLFLMVAAVIIIIHLSGWQLLKRLGYSMMLLYFIFLVFSLLLEYNVIFPTCIPPWEQ